MLNWRGLPYYVGKQLFGAQAWKACLDEVRQSGIERLSDRLLHQLLNHACENVPYYQGLDLDGRPLSDYPILTKSHIRANSALFKSQDLAGRQFASVATSGSTGEPLELLKDRRSTAWHEATTSWYFSQVLDTSDWRRLRGFHLYLWHHRQNARRPISLRARLARLLLPRKWLEPGVALSEEALLNYAREINRARPSFIWAYAGALYELARTAQNHELALHTPLFIISSAETLHPFMRREIEEAFRCRVYNLYGSTEAGYVAAECSAGNMHVFRFASEVEVLDTASRPVSPGNTGRLVVTPLHNYAMPLIRYDTADVATAGPPDCACGCQLPALSQIDGRTTQFFVTSDGSLLTSGRLALLMNGCRWIQSFHLLQDAPDRMEILFTRVAGCSVPEEEMEAVGVEISRYMGAKCQIEWREVESIPRMPNGKRPYARSLVWEESLPFSLWELS